MKLKLDVEDGKEKKKNGNNITRNYSLPNVGREYDRDLLSPLMNVKSSPSSSSCKTLSDQLKFTASL